MDLFFTSIILGRFWFVGLPPWTPPSSGKEGRSKKTRNTGRFSWKKLGKGLRKAAGGAGNGAAASSNYDNSAARGASIPVNSSQHSASLNRLVSVNLPVENLVISSHVTGAVPVKAVVTGIKTADLLLKGIKAVHGVMILLDAQGGSVVALGTPDGLLLGFKAAKLVIKGFKMSQKALNSGPKPTGPVGKMFKDVSSGFKASFGALNLLGSSKAILTEFSSGRVAMVNWNLIVKGYEASKGALNAVEALTSLRVGFVAAFGKGLLSLKGAISGVGVMIKACAVSKEVFVFLIKTISVSHGTREVLKMIAERRKQDRKRQGSSKLEVAVQAIQLRVRVSRNFGGCTTGVLQLGPAGYHRRVAVRARLVNSDEEEYVVESFSELASVLSVQGLNAQETF